VADFNVLLGFLVPAVCIVYILGVAIRSLKR